jgi:hypothetical protein
MLQSDMDSMGDARGKFLEQLMGDRMHLFTEEVQSRIMSGLKPLK